MFVAYDNLIKLLSRLRRIFLEVEQDIGILVIFLFSILLLDDFGFLRNLRVMCECNRSKPDLFDRSMLAKELLELLTTRVKRHIANKDSSFSSLL